jgi:hypothetical protein
LGPCFRVANFSGRLRERKGRREIMGRIMSVTSELAQAVKAAARLVRFLLVKKGVRDCG